MRMVRGGKSIYDPKVLRQREEEERIAMAAAWKDPKVQDAVADNMMKEMDYALRVDKRDSYDENPQFENPLVIQVCKK